MKCLKIFQKAEVLTAISLKVELSDNVWHANAEVQIRDDALEDINFDEQTYILTCEQLNDNCILLKYTKQNESSVQNLQLNNTVWMPLETCSCTSRTADVVGSTDSSEKRKMGKTKAYPSQKEWVYSVVILETCPSTFDAKNLLFVVT